PDEARWGALLGRSEEVGSALDAACQKLEESNPLLRRVLTGRRFAVVGLVAPEGYRVLEQLVRHIAQMPRFSSELIASGVLGEACEALLLKFADESGHRMPYFSTPSSITQLMVELMELRPGMRICDRVCGVGSFLTACARRVTRLRSGGA